MRKRNPGRLIVWEGYGTSFEANELMWFFRNISTVECLFSSKSLGLLVAVVLGLSAVFPSMPALANVTGEGDVTPVGPTDLPIGGGTATGDVIVGDTSVGRLTIDAPAFTDPLNSPNGFIGNSVTGIGVATISGFDLSQSEWDVDTLLTVGVAGQGYLNVTGGGLLTVGDDTAVPGEYMTGDIIVGDNEFSQGIVDISGFASIVETRNITVGELGFATFDVSNQANIRAVTTIIGNEQESIGRVSLNGLGTRWIMREENDNDFIVGEEGRATLELFDGAMLLNQEDVSVARLAGSHGVVNLHGQDTLWQIDDGSGTGTDDLAIGPAGSAEFHISDTAMLRVSDDISIGDTSFVDFSDGGIINADSIANSGVIRGDGRIESNLTILGTGELRNKANVEDIREHMYVTGTVTNGGTIESIGGEMEFESAVTNNLEVVARDAIMRFNGGFSNIIPGQVVLGGDTTIYSPGTFLSEGDIHVLADSSALIVGNVTFSSAAANTLSLAVGDAPGTLDVFGNVDLGMATLELDYAAGVSAQPGDTYQILSSTGLITGTFDNPNDEVTDETGQIWDITGYGTDTLYVTATGNVVPSVTGDFNGDDSVNGLDFLLWQRGFGGIYDENDFLDWSHNFPTIAAPAVAASFAAAVIPEPSTIALLLISGGFLVGIRRSRC